MFIYVIFVYSPKNIYLILILYMKYICMCIYKYLSFSNVLYCITKFYCSYCYSHCSSAWPWISPHHVCLGNSLNKILNFWAELICSVKGACSFKKSNKWNASSQPALECYWLALQSVKRTKAGMCFQYESIFRRIIHLGDLFHKKTFTKKVNTFSTLIQIEQDLWQWHICIESRSGQGSACSARTSADTSLCSRATVDVCILLADSFS